jgi:hypothetical protein
MRMPWDTHEILKEKGLQPNEYNSKQLSFLKHTSLPEALPAGTPQGVIQTALLFPQRGLP